jgi:mannose-1-phosphate guanylyltransferase
MKLILLSGGSGKRLWPLSNDTRSKQFLKVLEHKNEKQSMVQRVWGQLNTVGLANSSDIFLGPQLKKWSKTTTSTSTKNLKLASKHPENLLNHVLKFGRTHSNSFSKIVFLL